MDYLFITWDEKKNITNQNKHGIAFEDAKYAFWDDFAVKFRDRKHSHDEDRFLLLGKDVCDRVLIICHCCLESESVVRIISARKATKTERTYYVGGGK